MSAADSVAALAAYIAQNGPIQTVRVSSAQARGAAKRYAYWGAVRYEVRLTRDGAPSACAQERASSDRRSRRLAESDAAAIAVREDRVECQAIGRLDQRTCAMLLELVAPTNKIAVAS